MGLGNQNPHCPPGAKPGCRLLPRCVFLIWAQGLGREGCVGRAAVCQPPRGGTPGGCWHPWGRLLCPPPAFGKSGLQGSGHDSASCQPHEVRNAQRKDLL